MKILFDSDVLIALRFPAQSTHAYAKKVFKKISKQNNDFYCLNLCFHEVATVISHKYSQTQAKQFYREIQKNPPNIIFLDKDIEKAAWKIFLQQKRKNISFVDCANLATVKLYKLDKIFSFDKFYPNLIRLFS